MKYQICYFNVRADLSNSGKLVLSNPLFVTADSIYHLRSHLDTLCDRDDVIVLSVEPQAPLHEHKKY